MLGILRKGSREPKSKVTPLRKKILDLLPKGNENDFSFTPKKIHSSLDEKYSMEEIKRELLDMYHNGAVTKCHMGNNREYSYTL